MCLVTVTIARAIELKHAPGLIAALAYETANFYQKAGKLLILLLHFLVFSFSDLFDLELIGNKTKGFSDSVIICKTGVILYRI